MIGLGLIIGIPLLFALIIVIIVLFAALFGIGTGFVSSVFSFAPIATPFIIENPLFSTITFAFVIGIPLIVLIYSLVSYFMKLKPVHTGVKWTGLIVWIVALILFFFSGIRLNWESISSEYVPSFDYYSEKSPENTIEGSGIIIDKQEFFPASLKKIQIEDIEATIQIEQVKGDSISVLLNGDSNLVDMIQAKDVSGEKLKIMKSVSGSFRSLVPLII
ncbi:MAG: hypothetical protein LIO93_01700 [Bacteroidales bacterium]|nr:hypothetical protein [Bacteroidales bacterium]